MRVAIYARYSSAEHQTERSIEDQVRLCREFAAERGWPVCKVYTDPGISGASLWTRPEARDMLQGVRAGEFDLILAEALDRLSRDQEDTAGLFKRIRHAGGTLFTVHEGEITPLHIGFKGTMNAMFLEDLANKIRRGQKGTIANGRCPGGLAYGYKVVNEVDTRGELIRGKRAINDKEAQVVRRIYSEYANGRSAREIAHGLNKDGIPAPKGGTWRGSTIKGNRARGSGILWNLTYAGNLVHERTRFSKDPDTGNRLSRAQPAENWIIEPAPELRIVDEETWERVQAIHARFTNMSGPRPQKRPRHVLSGLVKCARCGGSYQVADKTGKMRCATHKETGTCDNNRTVKRQDVENRVFGALKERMLAPEALAAFVETYQDETARLRAETARQEINLTKRLQDLDRKVRNIVDAIAEGYATKAMKESLAEIEHERDEAIASLSVLTADTSVVELHPKALEEYRRSATSLFEALELDDVAVSEAGILIRDAIDHILVKPLEKRGTYDLELVTKLDVLMMLPERARSGGAVVAEEGYIRNPTSATLLRIAC